MRNADGGVCAKRIETKGNAMVMAIKNAEVQR